MNWSWKVALPLCVGLWGGTAISEIIHAQAGPPAYYVVDISNITDAEGFKTVGARSNAEKRKFASWSTRQRPTQCCADIMRPDS